MKFTAVILAGGKGLELYPLTPKHPKALLPIGNKSMICYQLELLCIANISNIIVLINESTCKVEEEVKRIYKGSVPIAFHYAEDDLQTYRALGDLFRRKETEDHLIITSCDTLTNFNIKDPIQKYIELKSDLMVVAQQPEPVDKTKQKEKKGESEPELDLYVLGKEDEILFTDLLSEAEASSVKLSNLLLRKAVTSRFEKGEDSHIYIISNRIKNIVKQLNHEDLANFKTDFIPFLSKNQNNIRLLKYAQEEAEYEGKSKPPVPIRLHAWINRDLTLFCKRIRDIKEYQLINLRSLVRGPKQLPLLLPTQYTQPFGESKFESTLLSTTAQVKDNVTVKRSCIGPGVRLAKGVQIVGCTILKDVSIGQGSKLYNCVVGSRAHIQTGCTLKNCQVGCESIVREGSSFNGQVIISE